MVVKVIGNKIVSRLCEALSLCLILLGKIIPLTMEAISRSDPWASLSEESPQTVSFCKETAYGHSVVFGIIFANSAIIRYWWWTLIYQGR